MHIPRYWRAQDQRYSLTGEICKQCGTRLFPPRDLCPECRELALGLFASDLDNGIYPLFTQAPEVHGERLSQIVDLIKLRV